MEGVAITDLEVGLEVVAALDLDGLDHQGEVQLVDDAVDNGDLELFEGAMEVESVKALVDNGPCSAPAERVSELLSRQVLAAGLLQKTQGNQGILGVIGERAGGRVAAVVAKSPTMDGVEFLREEVEHLLAATSDVVDAVVLDASELLQLPLLLFFFYLVVVADELNSLREVCVSVD